MRSGRQTGHRGQAHRTHHGQAEVPVTLADRCLGSRAWAGLLRRSRINARTATFVEIPIPSPAGRTYSARAMQTPGARISQRGRDHVRRLSLYWLARLFHGGREALGRGLLAMGLVVGQLLAPASVAAAAAPSSNATT